METVIMITAVTAIFFGDLYIKNRVEESGISGREKKLLGGRLLIRKHHNRGAALNLGETWGKNIVAAVSLILCVILTAVFVLCLTSRGNRLLRWGLTLLLGGAFSNTYDRLKRRYVVDYVSFGVKWKRLRRIVFNVSDFCIIIGAFLMALGSIKTGK